MSHETQRFFALTLTAFIVLVSVLFFTTEANAHTSTSSFTQKVKAGNMLAESLFGFLKR